MTSPTQSVLARNTQPGPTVFALDATGTSVVEWKGSGDLMGEDLQPVPPEFLGNIHFQRAVSRGIIEIVDAPEELTRVFDLHRQEWEHRTAAAKAASQAVLDQTPQNDVLSLGCVGPGGNGNPCGTPVPVRQQLRAERPPLCAMHAPLAPQFISEITDKIVDGKPEVKWVMAQMSQRTRQQ